MNIKNVSISNFRGIDSKKFTFNEGFNLIVGDNGRGKTSILEAIAVGIGGYIAGVPNTATRHFSLDEVRHEYRRAGEGSCEEIIYVPVEVTIDANLSGEMYSWTRSRISTKSSRTTTSPRDIVRLAEKISTSEDKILPILLYESAARIWAQKKEKSTNPFGKRYTRSIGYTDALGDASNIKMIRNWCVKMEFIGFNMKKNIEEYEAVKKAVSDFMSMMNQSDGAPNIEIFYDAQIEEIMYRQNDTILPVTTLSAGYQSLVWMVFDIAYRMALLNPQMGTRLTETPGVILIDELDMHLHPKWQWNVIRALRNVFPRVQFIATTHAPILFASAKDVEIIDIKGDNIEYKKSKYGLDVGNSVEFYQETSEYPEEVKRLSDRIMDNLDNENYAEAEKLLKELKNLIDEATPLITELETRLAFEKMDWR